MVLVVEAEADDAGLVVEGAVAAGRVDARLRGVLRGYTTERTTADEVRASGMGPYLTEQYRTVSARLEYPRTANVGIIRLLASGTLDLAPERVRSFGISAVNDAVTYATSHGGPFDRAVLTPPAR